MLEEIPKETIDRIVGGERHLFEEVIARYKRLVFSVVRRHIPYQQVEELAHEAFVLIYKDLKSFRGHSPFSFWIRTVTTRVCFNFWREQKRRGSREQPNLEEQEVITSLTRESIAHFEQEERRQRIGELLRRVVSGLTPEELMIFTLILVEERSVKETAQLLGLSLVNVKVRTHRLRSKLRKLIETYEEQ